MRRLGALAVTIMFFFSLTGCTSTRVAVVTPARLFQESESGKAGMEHLKQIETTIQEQLEVAQGLIAKAPDDEALRARFQKVFLGYQQVINAEQQKVVESINKLMQSSLDKYRVQKGYAVIMSADGLLSYDPKIDVTNEILAEMNRNKVAFEPVKLEEFAPAASSGKPRAAKPVPAPPASNSTRPAAPSTE